MTLTEELRASTVNYFTRPWLLRHAADRIDELEAIVERDHALIERLERCLLADHLQRR